ncbi:hypothetical protein [Chitiniphilus shinanonensis]|uniref:hypothetical protein n=1 Tax=Chitiniphilus shinanonensis TaxID=553088 RepID=UPI0012FBD5DF|nr:hypothetical protein [Chitiniphilus shinanonensis]
MAPFFDPGMAQAVVLQYQSRRFRLERHHDPSMMAHLGTKKAGAARVAGGGFGHRKNKQVQGNGMTSKDETFIDPATCPSRR